MLVVVKDGYVELPLQRGLDLEALGGGDILKVDAAEGGRERADGGDDLARPVGVEADGHGVHAAELLEEQGLALHDGQGRERAYVPEPEHGGAVRDDGDEVPAGGELPGGLRAAGDLPAGLGHAGRVGGGERVAVPHRHLGRELYLAPVLPVQPHSGLVVVHAASSLKTDAPPQGRAHYITLPPG